MQVDPIKPMLKAPETHLLKLRYDEPLSKFAFKLNLRRYNEVMLAFHLDDSQIAKDALVEMSFYVPPTSAKWGVDENEDDAEDTVGRCRLTL